MPRTKKSKLRSKSVFGESVNELMHDLNYPPRAAKGAIKYGQEQRVLRKKEDEDYREYIKRVEKKYNR